MEKVINGVSCRVVEKEWDVYFDMALTMFEEIVKNNRTGKPSVFIVPVGPTDQYPILAKLINSQRVSLKNVHFFNMDEYLASRGVRCGVVPVHQDGKAIGGVPALQREEGLSCICNRCFRRCGDRRNGLGLAVADPGRVARGDDVALNVHNTDNILRCLRELFCNVLKNPT